MSSHGFADFLEQLQADGRLSRCDDVVDRRLEAVEKAAQAAPAALLFTSVADAGFPLITGLFGSRRQMETALGSSLDETAARLVGLLEGDENGDWFNRLGGGRSKGLRGFQPRHVRTGPVQQIVRLGGDVDLARLPVPAMHAAETSPAITAGRLFTRPPDGKQPHVGRFSFRVIGPNRLAACWPPFSEPARLLTEYRRRGQTMPVAIVLGGEPCDLFTAMAPLPSQADVLGLTGYMKRRPCELVSGRAVELAVPADAEFVIEGTIDPEADCCQPGTGLDATGQLHALRPCPVVSVEAVTHRATTVFPSLIPSEACLLRQTLVGLFQPLLRRELPGLVELHLPAFGGAASWAFASIDKSYRDQGTQFAHAFWGHAAMQRVRYLVIVDADVDVDDSDTVWAAVSAHAAPALDVRVNESLADEFDYAPSPGRMVIDATRPVSRIP